VQEPLPSPDGNVPAGRDPATVVMLKSGDATGLRHLLEDHGGMVRARLRKRFHRVLDDSEIDESLHLAAIQVWRSAGTYDSNLGPLRAWFSAIANNCALKLLQKRKRAGFSLNVDLDQHPVAVQTVMPPTSARQKLLLDTMACLEKLPRLQRSILQADLDAGGQAPAATLASQFDTSTNSIYVSRLKGLRSLRRMLAELGHRSDNGATTQTDPPGLQAESG
jgi:DNA-directed RNA polymerase specialized sigma24 family protein